MGPTGDKIEGLGGTPGLVAIAASQECHPPPLSLPQHTSCSLPLNPTVWSHPGFGRARKVCVTSIPGRLSAPSPLCSWAWRERSRSLGPGAEPGSLCLCGLLAPASQMEGQRAWAGTGGGGQEVDCLPCIVATGAGQSLAWPCGWKCKPCVADGCRARSPMGVVSCPHRLAEGVAFTGPTRGAEGTTPVPPALSARTQPHTAVTPCG